MTYAEQQYKKIIEGEKAQKELIFEYEDISLACFMDGSICFEECDLLQKDAINLANWILKMFSPVESEEDK